ncbi:nose resistant to fluoxetine protein 6 [Orussus abietinus]|uniref:nose resistant to fluoxetine protein 6 n=1 Tax=Orussus abietinus TaxID=222816 RepID=UPI0006269B1E|nr:nose resistant to fluoxetine protein 6 [Orussus abietinus]
MPMREGGRMGYLARYAIFFLGLCWVVQPSVSGNETNILRLSKPSRISHDGGKLEILDSADGSKNESRTPSKPLVEFSKNNPELDWKNQLHMVANHDQVPRDLDVDFMREELQKTGNSIQWLADLYDPLKWTRVPGNLGESCRRDMEWYLRALGRGHLWAAKMSDASGRYSSQFHFGNGFWLGSSALCKELNTTVSPHPTGDAEDAPPYPLRFHVARLYLTLPNDLMQSTRQVFLGLCLPGTCDRTSLMSLLRASADRVEREGNATHATGGPKVHIVAIKSIPSNDYHMTSDPKFYILLGIGCTILFLMLCASIYQNRGTEQGRDIESPCARNNNERINSFPDRNIPEERRITMVQENGKGMTKKSNKSEKTQTADVAKPQVERGFWVRFLLAFDPVANGSKICSTELAPEDSLTCLHGLRFLSLSWVVMVHTYLQVFSIAENKTLRTVTERNFMFQTISNATFSVDTFFFISGLLVTIIYYRSQRDARNDKKNFMASGFMKFVVMIVYRFVRLTPAYLFVLGLNEIFMKQAMSRTVFSPAIFDHINCEKFWWRNALYINSLYPRTEMCMLWSWYMANDTQFYVLGIFLLILSIKFFKFVAVIIFFLVTSSWFTTFTIAYKNDYIARIQEPFALFDELYDKPWLRVGPYFVGAITGYILFKTDCKFRSPLIIRVIGWPVSLVVMFSVVYGLYPGNMTVFLSSIYAALAHTAWALAVAFIVFQCCTGSAALINKLLSLRLMYPLSRLTYCAYLVHPVIMMITSNKMDGPLHLHNDLVLIVFFGNLVASYLMSFCISIALEAPIVNLLKTALMGKKRAR